MSPLLEICCITVILFATSNLWFYIRVLRPLHHLAYQADRLSQGHLESLDYESRSIPEVQQLRRAMAGMVGHVRRAQAQHRAYTDHLAGAQENERKRLAHELHDDAVQSAIAVTQAIDMAKTLMQTDMPHATKMLSLAREQTVALVNSLRNLIGGLRPPALGELGLIPALEMQIDAVQQVNVDLNICGEVRRLDEEQELALFRVVQEALNNVVRHSEAKAVAVEMVYKPTSILLTVRDDGKGFTLPPTLGELALQQHYGLLAIQERINSLNGHLKIRSAPGHGTTLSVSLSLSEQSQPNNCVQDPVCCVVIEPQHAYGSVEYGNEIYYFCCPVCQGAFQRNPQRFIQQEPA